MTVEAQVEYIPLDDASVDAAVASVTAHHWNRPEDGFNELARVIRPGDRLVLAEFRPAGPLLRRVRQLARSEHVNAPKAEERETRLRSAGFGDVQEVRMGPASHLALFIRAVAASLLPLSHRFNLVE